MNEDANGKAMTLKTLFSRTTSVALDIKSAPSIVWTLLTTAAGYTIWNTTIVSLEGDIALGNTIQLKSTLDPKRTFKLKIKEYVEQTKLVWGDAMGERTYFMTDNGSGQVHFSMSEKIGGPMFPLFASKIPSFDASFEQFAADLKKAAETDLI